MSKLLCVLAGLAVVWGLSRALQQAKPREGFDFVTYYAAGKLATSSESAAVYHRVAGDESKIPLDGVLFREAYEAGVPWCGQYYNLPICLLLFKPLALLRFEHAYRLVTALNLASLLLTAWMAVQAAAPRATPVGRWIGFACLSVVACSSHPVLYNARIGNLSPLLALACVVAWVWDSRGHTVLAGTALGLSIIFKPSPLPLLLYFALRRRWPTVVSTLVTVAALLAIGLAYYGVAMHMRWYELIAYYADRTFVAWNNQSLSAGLLRLTVRAEEIVAWEVIAEPLWVIGLERLSVLTGFAWWLACFRRWSTSQGAAMGYAAGLLLVNIASPFAWTHYYVVAIWPIAILAGELWHGERRGAGRLALLALSVVTWAADPMALFEFARNWRLLPPVGPLARGLVVSNTLATAVLWFIWLQRRRPPRETHGG